MTLIVEKRTRATANDPWGSWDNTDVDAVTDGTFTDTSIVQYRTTPDILVSDITDNVAVDGSFVVTGDGLFDNLMETVSTHIGAQFDLGRISGVDYATVYLGAMQSALQQSIGFVLQEKSVEKDIELKSAQITTTEAQKAEVTAGTIRNDLMASKEAALKDEQKDLTNGKIAVDTAMVIRQDLVASKQIAKLDEDKELVTSQKAEITAGTIRQDLLASKQANTAQLDYDIKDDQWNNYQSTIMSNQVSMSSTDETNHATLKASEVSLKAAQVTQATNEASFIASKETVMEATRKDNVRIKTAQEFANFMKYCFAADLNLDADDYQNLRYLIERISAGISDPDAVIVDDAAVTTFKLAPTNDPA